MENTERNMLLVERFGDLERLCNQIYADRHGVTIYIDEMRNISMQAAYVVPDWARFLKRLTDVRHKRNKLTHGEVSFSQQWAEESDIEFLEDFREDLLRQRDPLALYRKRVEEQRREAQRRAALQRKENVDRPVSVQRTVRSAEIKRRRGCLPIMMAILMIIVFLLLWMLAL